MKPNREKTGYSDLHGVPIRHTDTVISYRTQLEGRVCQKKDERYYIEWIGGMSFTQPIEFATNEIRVVV